MNHYKNRPNSINIELTTKCPLECPQCYLGFNKEVKHIDKDIAIKRIREAGEMGVRIVCLSGGETLCYPYIYELAEAASQYCGAAFVALSGYGLNEAVYDNLKNKVSGIFISLNGSTFNINKVTRAGFDYAISALELLYKKAYKHIWINWVMYSHNIYDFDNMIMLAEKYGVYCIVIMAPKPNSYNELKDMPTREQMIYFAKKIALYKGRVRIMVEPCFSPMLALMLGEKNTGLNYGCGAGIVNFNINVDGLFSPCRHLDFFEEFDSAKDYWNNSQALNILRNAEKRQPCISCKFTDYCRHCIAYNVKLNHEVYIGNAACKISAL